MLLAKECLLPKAISSFQCSSFRVASGPDANGGHDPKKNHCVSYSLAPDFLIISGTDPNGQEAQLNDILCAMSESIRYGLQISDRTAGHCEVCPSADRLVSKWIGPFSAAPSAAGLGIRRFNV